ncbi:hypothetical protein D3C78_693750 [compost metagenome]
MNRLPQPIQQLEQVIHMLPSGETTPLAIPFFRVVMPKAWYHQAKILPQTTQLPLPITVIAQRAVHEHQRHPFTFIQASQLIAINPVRQNSRTHPPPSNPQPPECRNSHTKKEDLPRHTAIIQQPGSIHTTRTAGHEFGQEVRPREKQRKMNNQQTELTLSRINLDNKSVTQTLNWST